MRAPRSLRTLQKAAPSSIAAPTIEISAGRPNPLQGAAVNGAIEEAATMTGITTIAFDHPDESRTFAHGRSDIVRVGNSAVAQISLEPKWHWADDVKPLVGTDTCQVRHVGYLVSGRLRVTMDDGSELEIAPGQAYVIEPGHDAFVVGNDKVVAVEFSTEAAETYAKTGR